jgi:hypothetical protein
MQVQQCLNTIHFWHIQIKKRIEHRNRVTCFRFATHVTAVVTPNFPFHVFYSTGNSNHLCTRIFNEATGNFWRLCSQSVLVWWHCFICACPAMHWFISVDEFLVGEKKENGSAYQRSCFWEQGSFVEDAVGAEVFLRTWNATERWCTEQEFSHIPFWSTPPRDALVVVPAIHLHLRKQVWCCAILIIFRLEN